jgi:hypothetical protein
MEGALSHKVSIKIGHIKVAIKKRNKNKIEKKNR